TFLSRARAAPMEFGSKRVRNTEQDQREQRACRTRGSRLQPSDFTKLSVGTSDRRRVCGQPNGEPMKHVYWIACVAVAGCVAIDADSERNIDAVQQRYAQPRLQMTKVVFRDVSPSVAAGSHAAAPRTLYRIPPTWGRMEEPKNPETGKQWVTI